jgi:hypothetical protein
LPETPDLELAQIYAKLLLIANDAAFHDGEWMLLDVSPDSDGTHANLIAYRWRGNAGFRLVVVNLAANTSQGRIAVAGELEPAARYDFRDLLDGQVYVRERTDLAEAGLYVRLDGHHAHLFSVAPGAA